MSAEDGIFIDHGQALSFAQEMQEQTQRIGSLISTLESELAPIAGNWLGPDRDVYFTRVQPTWNSEVHALGTILSSHAQTLQDVSDNYRRTVAQNAQGFEEIRF